MEIKYNVTISTKTGRTKRNEIIVLDLPENATVGQVIRKMIAEGYGPEHALLSYSVK